MTEATLAKWLKKEGDKINPGDMIAEVETDKATQELEVFEGGTVAKILIPEGGKTPVGALIVVIAKAGEDVKTVAAGVKMPTNGTPTKAPAAAPKASIENTTNEKAPIGASAGSPAPAVPTAVAPTSPVAVEDHNEGSEPEVLHAGKVRVSPLARKIADEKGIDVSTLRGTGPEGRIIKRDVLDAAARPAAPKPAPAAQPRLQGAR